MPFTCALYLPLEGDLSSGRSGYPLLSVRICRAGPPIDRPAVPSTVCDWAAESMSSKKTHHHEETAVLREINHILHHYLYQYYRWCFILCQHFNIFVFNQFVQNSGKEMKHWIIIPFNNVPTMDSNNVHKNILCCYKSVLMNSSIILRSLEIYFIPFWLKATWDTVQPFSSEASSPRCPFSVQEWEMPGLPRILHHLSQQLLHISSMLWPLYYAKF